MIVWPDAEFAGHVVPGSGTAEALAQEIFALLIERRMDLSNLRCLITDGCMKMVGWKTGTHAVLEKLVDRELQRIICFFHHLELSFGKIFTLYDGKTLSPDDFKGPIGKLIKSDVHLLDITTFPILPNQSLFDLVESFPEEALNDLSQDHKIFIMIAKIVITGDIVRRWTDMRIGPLVHSRHTTTETRCLRLYLSTPEPSYELSRVVHYLIYVWSEVFLRSKIRNTCVEGPRLLLLETILTRVHCSYSERSALYPSLNTNGQYCHPENVLLSLLASPVENERRQAIDIIFLIRLRGPVQWNTPSGKRPFKVILLHIYSFLGL